MTGVAVSRHQDRHRWVPSRSSVGAVFQHQLRRTRKVWGSALAAGLASPTIFLLALGLGLGSQIDEAELAKLGVDSYLDFIGPGVLMVTAMQVASIESMWPTMGLLRWGGIYKAVLASPITSAELGLAHVLWIGFRSMVTAICFLVVLAIAGALSSVLAILIPLVAVLVAWVHAGPLVSLTVALKNESNFAILSRAVVFPLFLFSGAFFPVEDMPVAIAFAAKLTPSWHGVELARHLAAGNIAVVDLLHVGYLVVLSFAGFVIVQKQFRKHLDL